MSFRFSLATLLRLREISEEREERALGRLLSEMAHAAQNLGELGTQRAEVARVRVRSMSAAISAAEIHISYQRVAFLEKREAEVKEELSKLELLRQEQLRKYEAAHRDREVLSGMREEQVDQYRREQLRREQNIMDDNFSSRKALL